MGWAGSGVAPGMLAGMAGLAAAKPSAARHLCLLPFQPAATLPPRSMQAPAGLWPPRCPCHHWRQECDSGPVRTSWRLCQACRGVPCSAALAPSAPSVHPHSPAAAATHTWHRSASTMRSLVAARCTAAVGSLGPLRCHEGGMAWRPWLGCHDVLPHPSPVQAAPLCTSEWCCWRRTGEAWAWRGSGGSRARCASLSWLGSMRRLAMLMLCCGAPLPCCSVLDGDAWSSEDAVFPEVPGSRQHPWGAPVAMLCMLRGALRSCRMHV